MTRYPWIIWLGGGILGYVAGEMILKDDLVRGALGKLGDALHYPLPAVLGVALAFLGWWQARAARLAPHPRGTR
jgi:predicted tellurium resistance membrane protein TerC